VLSFVEAEPTVQLLHPVTASLRRSRSRAWNVSQRPPIPTALLLMVTESVPGRNYASGVGARRRSRLAFHGVARPHRFLEPRCTRR
jgi:hypothetical protein